MQSFGNMPSVPLFVCNRVVSVLPRTPAGTHPLILVMATAFRFPRARAASCTPTAYPLQYASGELTFSERNTSACWTWWILRKNAKPLHARRCSLGCVCICQVGYPGQILAKIAGDVMSWRIELVLRGRCLGVRALVALLCRSAHVARSPTGGYLCETGTILALFHSSHNPRQNQ